MKRFFHQTYYFWLITRVIFMTAALLDAIRLIDQEALINMAVLAYLGLMVYNTIHEYRNTLNSRTTKYIAGVLSIVIAVVILGLAVRQDIQYLGAAGAFVIWIALLGIFDLLILNRSEENEEEPEQS